MIILKNKLMKNGDWGLGIGDLGMWPKPPTPKPKNQSPTPKTQKNNKIK